jgi:caffeoyl-CoA O-methyltransferase
MESFIKADILNYCETHTTSEPDTYKDLRAQTQAETNLPQMQVGHFEGNFLKLLAKSIQAKNIIEIGTFTGYSTLCLAEALPEDGALITCDFDPHVTNIAQEFWKQSPHGQKISLKLQPALKTLNELIQSSSQLFDFAFIDADKENYPSYYEKCMTLLRVGGLIVLDNALWGGRVLLPQKEHSNETSAIHNLNKTINNDHRVLHQLLPIRDGMHLVLKLKN